MEEEAIVVLRTFYGDGNPRAPPSKRQRSIKGEGDVVEA